MTLHRPIIVAFAAVLTVAAATVSVSLAADDPDVVKQKLRAIEGAIETGQDKARELEAAAAVEARSLATLRAEMQAAARAAQAHERAVIRLETERIGKSVV